MSLKEFLVTANPIDSLALEEAKLKRIGQLISPDMMLAFITKFGLVDVLLGSPMTNEAKAVQVAFQFGSEFNLIIDHPSNIISILDILITDQIIPSEFKDTLLDYANNKSPLSFPNVTLHDIQIIRDTVDLKPVVAHDSWVVIETNANCEKHNPRLIGQRIDILTDKIEKQRINSFYNVDSIGKYKAKVPTEWSEASLFVDNSYGVII